METKAKINGTELNLKETINRMKRQLTEWEKTFANDMTDTGLISKIYTELIQLNVTNNPIKKMDRDLNTHSFQRGDADVPTGT